MSKRYLTILAFVVVTGFGLTACSNESSDGVSNNTRAYVHSADTHPCLSVAVVTPDVLIGIETTVRVDVNNRCNEATTYESSGPPYSLALVRDDNKVVWYTPSEPVTAILLEYTVEGNGTTSYDVPALLSADTVSPGNYKMIANLFVHQIDPDATQYEKPLRLESEPQNVDVSL